MVDHPLLLSLGGTHKQLTVDMTYCEYNKNSVIGGTK